jgi:hypothetical protein
MAQNSPISQNSEKGDGFIFLSMGYPDVRSLPMNPARQDLKRPPASPGRLRDSRRLEPRRTRRFSLEEANHMLPLVRHITDDVMRLSCSIRHLSFRLRFITSGGDEIEQLFPLEIGAMRRRLDDLQIRLSECLEELDRLGVEPEAPTLGLIDFPSVVDERPAYLCLRHGEPAVGWWHSLTGGFVDRRPLREPVC